MALDPDIVRPSRRLARRVRAGLVGAGFRRSTAYGGDGLDVRRDPGTLNMSDVPTVLVELGNCLPPLTCDREGIPARNGLDTPHDHG